VALLVLPVDYMLTPHDFYHLEELQETGKMLRMRSWGAGKQSYRHKPCSPHYRQAPLSFPPLLFHTVNTLTAATLSNKPNTIKRVGRSHLDSSSLALFGRQALGPTSEDVSTFVWFCSPSLARPLRNRSRTCSIRVDGGRDAFKL
jgi:hypothetical protein